MTKSETPTMKEVGTLQANPQVWLYTLSVTLMMSAFHYNAELVAVQGGLLLVGTAWYTENRTEVR